MFEKTFGSAVVEYKNVHHNLKSMANKTRCRILLLDAC